MTTVTRPGGVSYVEQAARSVLAEGLPLLLVDGSAGSTSEDAARWAFAQPASVRYVRVPDALRHAAPPSGAGSFKQRDSALQQWRSRESLHWAWAVRAAVEQSDAPYVLYMEDDVVLARGAGDALAARLTDWLAREAGAVNAAPAAAKAAAVADSQRGMVSRRPPPPMADDPSKGWLGLSLWSADDLPDGHACDNCYTKALLFTRSTAGVLASHVAARHTEKPVDWLIADVERAGGARLRALVPQLAEHIGDFSSLQGLKREWQRSAWFKKHAFQAAGREQEGAPGGGRG